MGYCRDESEEGWLCVLPEGHEGQHVSVDNRKVWKGTPGMPVFWGDLQKEPKEPKDILVGDICGVCGQPSIIRESACRTRCKSCGAIEGGCG